MALDFTFVIKVVMCGAVAWDVFGAMHKGQGH